MLPSVQEPDQRHDVFPTAGWAGLGPTEPRGLDRVDCPAFQVQTEHGPGEGKMGDERREWRHLAVSP